MTDDDLAARVGVALQARNWRLAAAESCTGGWVAKRVTDVAGSSGWFDRGFVTYSNDAKTDLLGVDMALIEQHGAVSEAVVRAMAVGALDHSRADISVAVSGVAGPGGGTPDKPVGRVWFAWAMRDRIWAHSAQFTGDRDAVRRQAVEAALQGVLDACDGKT